MRFNSARESRGYSLHKEHIDMHCHFVHLTPCKTALKHYQSIENLYASLDHISLAFVIRRYSATEKTITVLAAFLLMDGDAFARILIFLISERESQLLRL